MKNALTIAFVLAFLVCGLLYVAPQIVTAMAR